MKYEVELINNEKKNLEANFNEKMRTLKENINPDMLTNIELNEKTARKMIANLVVENADMQKRIYKAVKYMQNKYDNSDLCGFTISFNEFEELKNILKY